MISPLWIIGAVLGVMSAGILLAFALIKDKKETIGFDRNMADSEIFRRLLRYAKPYAGSFVLVLFVMALTIAADIIMPLVLGAVTDILGQEQFEYKQILTYTLIYGAVLIVSCISMYAQAIILQRTGQKIISAMRTELFEHIENLSSEQLNNLPVGMLVTRVCNDTAAVSRMFTGILASVVKNVFLILGFTIAMFCVNVLLTLVVLCFVPFIVLFTLIFRMFSRKAYRKVKKDTTDINVFLSENLSGIKVTQIFNQEETKNRQFRARNDALNKSRLQEMSVFSVFRPCVYMLYLFSVLAMFYVAGKGVLDDIHFAGQVIAYPVVVIFYQYIKSFFGPIQTLADQFNRIQAAFASSEKFFSVLDLSATVTDSPDAQDLGVLQGKIEFRNVWFSYIPDEWVLKDVSFTVDVGQTVAFVGATGSGKSTILSLICRNYDIQKGQILIDGVDIKQIKLACLRRNFGQMLQDVFIFSGTIRSNIVLRDETITDEQINEACHYVNADHFINRLERGLDEPVRERGNNFSAGQRQLLSFARTIVHKPSVMILDEATANIDTETEVLIQDSLEKMMNIGTMLIVAHRLSTIQHADNIIVLSHGEIIEQGTHQQLLHNKGKYYNLYQLQFRKEQLTKAV